MSERYIDPERQQFEAFKTLARDTPVEMLNMIRFKDKATYPADHPAAAEGLSGAQAYARYGQAAAPHLARAGGEVVWRAAPEAVVIGPPDERWDAIFAVRYPSAAAFLAMITDGEYRKLAVHRTAAVETSRLIRTAPAPAGGEFA
jgi:uncharacterized protein (DUF1330 family)